jgi:hypothetical protein
LVVDEAQAVPEIFKDLKTAVDRDPRLGHYVVTGRRQFEVSAGVTAGSAAFLRLLSPRHDREVTPYDRYTNHLAW